MKHASKTKAKLLNAAQSFHHHPKAICITCTVNAFAETFYYTIDNQKYIQGSRPQEGYMAYSDNWTFTTLVSAADSSIHYLVKHLLVTEISEFEAFLSVARNMLERLSKIQYIIDNPHETERASDDFKDTVNDVTLLFECVEPSVTAGQLKAAKFLGKGINLSHISKQKYQLLFAYLSRVGHTYNLDVLLSPSYDRFYVKAYVLSSLVELYHDVLSKCAFLEDDALTLHQEALTTIMGYWKDKGVTPETLIYCTTYYHEDHSELELTKLQEYSKSLDNSFCMFESDHNNLVLPVFKVK